MTVCKLQTQQVDSGGGSCIVEFSSLDTQEIVRRTYPELHQDPGETKMKSMVRSYMWWPPRQGKELESLAKAVNLLIPLIIVFTIYYIWQLYIKDFFTLMIRTSMIKQLIIMWENYKVARYV